MNIDLISLSSSLMERACFQLVIYILRQFGQGHSINIEAVI